jgi:hypothetical protein
MALMPLAPGARIQLRKRISASLGNETWGDIDLMFQEFDLPTSDQWSGSQESYGLAMTRGATDEKLMGLDQYLREKVAEEIQAALAEARDEDDDNRPFDATEQAEIAAWAADLEQNAAERFDLTEQQLMALVGELRELVEGSGRLGRKDWYNAALGALVGLVLNKAAEAAVVQQVLEGMVSTLGHLFGHPIPQLGPGSIF